MHKATLLPFSGRDCAVQTINERPEQAFGTDEAMKAVGRQAKLGLSGRVPT